MPILSLDGSIGAGKSTLLALLEERAHELGIGLLTHPEPIEAWQPWLDRLYDRTYVGGSMELQLRVWLDRAAHQPATHGKQWVIVERSPQFQERVFLETNRALGYLTPAAATLLSELYVNAWVPDQFLYLRTDPSACAARIQHRGRHGEDAVSLDYLERLHAEHERTYKAMRASGGPIRAIDVEGRTPTEIADEIASALWGC